MSTYPTHAKIVLAGTGKPDEQYLDQWRDAPLTYQRGQPIDDTWHTDHYEKIIASAGKSPDELFQRAADLILHYQFYPPTLMTHVSDFSRDMRRMRAADRVIQRIRAGISFVEALTMNVIVHMIDEDSRAGFTYIATAAHSEMGEWSALIEKHPTGIKLTINALARTRPEFPPLLRGYTRRLQKRAHQLGIEHFTQQVLDR